MFNKLGVKKIKDKSGFTLIEVVTVLLIVSIGMTGILSLIVQNIRNQSINKNTLIAYQLAQEGIELVRSTRDTNWRNGNDWKINLAAGTYYTDYSLASLLPATNVPGSGKLSLSNDNYYVSSPDLKFVPGSFYRIISITYPDAANQEKMLVKSNIYWLENGGQHTYSLEAELYNWK